MVLALTQLVLALTVTGGLTTLHNHSNNYRSISLASQFSDLDPLRVDLTYRITKLACLPNCYHNISLAHTESPSVLLLNSVILLTKLLSQTKLAC